MLDCSSNLQILEKWKLVVPSEVILMSVHTISNSHKLYLVCYQDKANLLQNKEIHKRSSACSKTWFKCKHTRQVSENIAVICFNKSHAYRFSRNWMKINCLVCGDRVCYFETKSSFFKLSAVFQWNLLLTADK